MKYKKIMMIGISILIASAITAVGVRNVRAKEDARKQKAQEHLATEVLRFHVLANSDSEKDQALKMQVKEAVLAYMKKELPESKDLTQTKKWVGEHEEDIKIIGEEIVKEAGYDYKVTAQLTTCHFPDKTYGDITFPAGDYEALRIEIGDAKGHNWWCVLYPNLCFVDATHAVVPEEGKEELKAVLTEDEYEMVTATSDFKVSWYFLGDK
ncbi:stage II sporulation protein R [Lachnospiraceae bacterium LCP25S3_G4]